MYKRQAIEKDEECLKNTFDLFNHSFFNDWFIAQPRVYDYAEQNKSRKGYLIKKMTYQKAEKLFSKFTEELIEPNADKVKTVSYTHLWILRLMLEFSVAPDFILF